MGNGALASSALKPSLHGRLLQLPAPLPWAIQRGWGWHSPLPSPRGSPAPSPQKQELPLGSCSSLTGHFQVDPLLETTLMCRFLIGKQKSRRAVPSSWHDPIPASLFQGMAPSCWNSEQSMVEKWQELASQRHPATGSALGCGSWDGPMDGAGQSFPIGMRIHSHPSAWEGEGGRASSSTQKKPQNAGIGVYFAAL